MKAQLTAQPCWPESEVAYGLQWMKRRSGHVRTTIKPEPESARLMDQRYQNYQLIYPALRDRLLS